MTWNGKEGWVEVGRIQSTSDYSKQWPIDKHSETGHLRCHCKGFIFSGTKRDCKHIRFYKAVGGTPVRVTTPYEQAVGALATNIENNVMFGFSDTHKTLTDLLLRELSKLPSLGAAATTTAPVETVSAEFRLITFDEAPV
jgi:hypothetical protein